VTTILSGILNGFFESINRVLIDAILSTLMSLFDSMNEQVADVAYQVGQTPMEWQGGSIFSMIRGLSETVILPIAGLVLAFILTYELIQSITEKNNMADFDVANLFKWMVKSFIAIFILTNTFNIVGAAFELGQHAIIGAAGYITGNIELGSPEMIASLIETLEDMPTGELFTLLVEMQILRIVFPILGIAVFLVTVGRFLEIYMTIALAPIPLATLANRDWSGMGQNYVKGLLAVAFQGFLMMISVAIFTQLMNIWGAELASGGDFIVGIWRTLGFSLLLVIMLFKSGSLSKSLFGAH